MNTRRQFKWDRVSLSLVMCHTKRIHFTNKLLPPATEDMCACLHTYLRYCMSAMVYMCTCGMSEWVSEANKFARVITRARNTDWWPSIPVTGPLVCQLQSTTESQPMHLPYSTTKLCAFCISLPLFFREESILVHFVAPYVCLICWLFQDNQFHIARLRTWIENVSCLMYVHTWKHFGCVPAAVWLL